MKTTEREAVRTRERFRERVAAARAAGRLHVAALQRRRRTVRASPQQPRTQSELLTTIPTRSRSELDVLFCLTTEQAQAAVSSLPGQINSVAIGTSNSSTPGVCTSAHLGAKRSKRSVLYFFAAFGRSRSELELIAFVSYAHRCCDLRRPWRLQSYLFSG